jgi:Na+-transporting NADH:ubiquinone oxidoreductase subunit D
MRHGIAASVLDGLGNGLGYGLVLVSVGSVRELLGTGRLLGVQLLPLVDQGGWFEPIGLMLRPPSAFLLIAGMIWALRSGRRRSAARAAEAHGSVAGASTGAAGAAGETA